uniref:Protein kinase domain-containing protein n=1 Tax=Panagrolaimus sp. JU765 TaxID=591449 RepID=A0AC34PVX4_9BILA
SLGCLLYEMCNFRSPFNGELSNVYALHKKISGGVVPPFATKIYSKFIHILIKSCMKINPDDRPTAEECFEAAARMFTACQTRYLAMMNGAM